MSTYHANVQWQKEVGKAAYWQARSDQPWCVIGVRYSWGWQYFAVAKSSHSYQHRDEIRRVWAS